VPLLYPRGIARSPVEFSWLLGSTRDSSHEWSTGWKDKAAYTRLAAAWIGGWLTDN
jgi:hypothetical protein